MSEYPDGSNRSAAANESADTPYELLPTLANNERFVQVASELRRLKQLKDELFEDRIGDDGKKRPSYWDELKLEAGALAMAAGGKSVAFIDLRIAQTEGSAASMKVTGASLIAEYGPKMTAEQIYAAVKAAKEMDINVLLVAGIPAHVIAAATVPVGKPRSASTRIEWIGKKGKRAGTPGAGSSGSIQ